MSVFKEKICVLLFVFIIPVSLFAVDTDAIFNINSAEIKKNNLLIEEINFFGKNKSSTKYIQQILNTIHYDLMTTNLFAIDKIEESVFQDFERNKNLSKTDLTDLIMSRYSSSNYDAVLSGYLDINEKDQIELTIKLWDILDQREIFSQLYILQKDNLKKVGDRIANNIYKLLTGEQFGHFDSKLLFVAESGSIKNRKKAIAMMNFDGSDLRYITNGKNITITPVFSHYTDNEVFFLEYKKNKKPKLFKFNIKDKILTSIGDETEMTFAPNFNPNGNNEIVFSASKDGISNIFKINFNDSKVVQLTNDHAISTVPAWSPDGQYIVYVSDKSGSRKLYTMTKDGKDVKMISQNYGIYDKPSWSPDGKLISFIKIQNGVFSIGLMTPSGENERIIMNAYFVEGVKWSPNGRYLIYSKQRGPFGVDSIPSIYIMDVMTGFEYKINIPKNIGATDPDWINNE